jgi:apolipoprotein N-acyltransferase
VGALICYEDILPRFTRQVAAKGADVFINVTNDAWFGKTAEPYLHLALAIFRTVENRRYMIRSTNTGVSAFIDANGRIVSATSLEEAELLIEDVPILQMETLYTRFGDVFMALCFMALAMFFIHGYWPQTRAGRK